MRIRALYGVERLQDGALIGNALLLVPADRGEHLLVVIGHDLLEIG